MTTQTESVLPPLPEPAYKPGAYGMSFDAWGANQMSDYALAAITADRAKRFVGPVLTDEQCLIIGAFGQSPLKRLDHARAIESAVLAKLKERP